MSIPELRQQAIALPLQERAELANELLLSLETPKNDDTSVLWAEESERRFEQYKQSGKSVKASEVLRRLAQRLEAEG
jgi:Putative addiction module component